MVTRIGWDSGLSYREHVLIENGLLTCEVCGRLPGYYAHPGVAEGAAKRHLSSSHTMVIDDD